MDAASVKCGPQRGGIRGADAHDRPTSQELRQRGVGDESAAGQDHDLVNGLGHLGQQMARDEHRASRRGVGAQELAQPADAFGVEAVGGLVQDEDVGIAEERGGEPEPLTHPEREAADPSAGGARQADVGEDLVDAVIREPGGGGEDAQVVPGPAAGVEARRLEHGADVTDRLIEGSIGATVDGGRAGGRGDEAEQQAQGRRLAGAVGSEEPDDPAAPELHGVAEALGETVECDDRHGWVSSPRAAPGSDADYLPTVRTRLGGVVGRARGCPSSSGGSREYCSRVTTNGRRFGTVAGVTSRRRLRARTGTLIAIDAVVAVVAIAVSWMILSADSIDWPAGSRAPDGLAYALV